MKRLRSHESATRARHARASDEGGIMSSRYALGLDTPNDKSSASDTRAEPNTEENETMKKDKMMIYLPATLAEEFKIRAVKEKKTNSKLAEEIIDAYLNGRLAPQ